MQFTEAPKISMKRKKKATEAVAVGFSTDVPVIFSICVYIYLGRYR
jgi:hypothetical protein